MIRYCYTFFCYIDVDNNATFIFTGLYSLSTCRRSNNIKHRTSRAELYELLVQVIGYEQICLKQCVSK